VKLTSRTRLVAAAREIVNEEIAAAVLTAEVGSMVVAKDFSAS